MFEQQPTLERLFQQLGLEADDASIESFVKPISSVLTRNYMKLSSGA